VARVYKVEELIESALKGMEPALVSATAEELVSASLTLSLRAIKTHLQMSPDSRTRMREAVGTLLMACADEGRPN